MIRWGLVFVLIAVCSMSLVVIVASVGSVPSASMTTDTRSSELMNDRAKIAFLKKYLKLHSEIDATEFHIYFRDGSDGWFPAPSERDMQVVMKVPRDKLHSWIVDVEPTDEDFDLAWGYELLPKHHRWSIQSDPTIYRRGTTVVAVFDQEGIVFKSVGDFLVLPPSEPDKHQTGSSFTLQPPDAVSK